MGSFAQKTIYVYNLSSTNFDIGQMYSKNSNPTNPYPKFSSSGALYIIPAGQSRTFAASPASVTKFPFQIAPINPWPNWIRVLVSGGSGTTLPSNIVANTYGNTQIFDFMKTQVGPNGSLGGGNLRPFIPPVTPTNPDWGSYTFGTSGLVTIDQDPPGTPGGTQEIYVIISD